MAHDAVGSPARLDRVAEAVRSLHRRLAGDRPEPGLPIEVVEAASLVGLRVTVVAEGLVGTVLRNEDGAPVSGVVDFATGRVYVDGREPVARQRFTIAHEIAHEVLGHEYRLGGGVHAVWTSDADGAELGAHRAGAGEDRLEREADRFAGELLVPPAQLRALVDRIGPSVPVLAERFGVSCAAMRRHLAPWLPSLEEEEES